MSDRSTPTVFENPIRLRRRARGFLIGAIVSWAVFLLVVLGSVAGSTMSAGDSGVVNGAEIAGRVIALILIIGVPTGLGVLFSVRSVRLYRRAADIELREASSY